MPDWHVSIHFDAPDDDPRGENLLDHLGPTAVVSAAPLDRVDLTWTLEARTLPDAFARALDDFAGAAADAGYGRPAPQAMHLWDDDGYDAYSAGLEVPAVIGYPRIAAEFGISRQRAQQLGSEGRFGPQLTARREKGADGPIEPPVFLESRVRAHFAGREPAPRPSRKGVTGAGG